MVLLISSTIAPSKNTGYLALRNVKERLQQYKECIQFYLNCNEIQKIVYCDNSMASEELFIEEKLEAEIKGKQLEFLSFQGDTTKVQEKGKGYGECEIILYAIKHSKLLTADASFIKVTGRLIVQNIDVILSHIKKGDLYINRVQNRKKKRADTRLYSMSVEMFKNIFQHSGEQVDDDKQIYLETVFWNIITKKGLCAKSFPRFPRIIGVSGSTGSVYSYREYKCKVKDCLSVIGYYRVKG